MQEKNFFKNVALLPSLGALVVIILVSTVERFSPGGLVHRPLEMLSWCGIAALAALYRPLERSPLGVPLGPSLGLGAIVLAPSLERLGVSPAALIASFAFFLAEFTHRFARRRSAADLRDGTWLADVLERTALVTGAVLAAGVLGRTLFDSDPGVSGVVVNALAPAAAYILMLGGISLALREIRRVTEHGPDPSEEVSEAPDASQATRDVRADLLPYLLDAAGWVVGALLADVALRHGWVYLWPLTALVALLAADAARNAILRDVIDLRVADMERVQDAHRRILSEVSGHGGTAHQIFTECRNVLPVQHFQLEILADAEVERRSWSAGPDGMLFEGEPHPTSRPDMLPGVHRRASWRVIESKLEAEDRVLARLFLWCDPRRIEAGAEELFHSLLPQMASSLHRAQLDREAKTDPLTGVPVRRLLESRLQQAFQRSSEEGSPVSVIMCDIDFFKRINDTWGHAAGDQALVVFARTLENHRRDQDLCCRYGGEEFTLLLENTRGDAALQLAERLRRAVEALHFEYEGERIPLTFSSGVASFPEVVIKTAGELMLLADEALYEAKETGRNRTLLNLGGGQFRGIAGR